MAVTDLNFLKQNLDLLNNPNLTPERQKLLDTRLTRILDAAEAEVQQRTGLAFIPRQSKILIDAQGIQGTDKPIMIPKRLFPSPVNSYMTVDGLFEDINTFEYFGSTGFPLIINPDWNGNSTVTDWRLYPADVEMETWPMGSDTRPEYTFKIFRWTNPLPDRIVQGVIVEAARIFENRTTDRSAMKALIEQWDRSQLDVFLLAPYMQIEL